MAVVASSVAAYPSNVMRDNYYFSRVFSIDIFQGYVCLYGGGDCRERQWVETENVVQDHERESSLHGYGAHHHVVITLVG